MSIDNRSGLVQLADHTAVAPDETVDNDIAAVTTDIQDALIDMDGTSTCRKLANKPSMI